MDDIHTSYRNNNRTGHCGNYRTAGTRCKTIKLTTALRALRRGAYALYGVIIWYTAAGWYSVGFTAWALVVVALIWWLFRRIVTMLSRKGRIWLGQII
jgi:hypothetical protein